uniref:Uncharacterized protein n=1 Tax=Hucho hucho TaxID=62062 RepID=A0A4W5RYU7_9TELE
MASSSRLLSEDQFQCSICLDVFTEPVSTPCGHNFCKACISGYWDTTDLCQCPMCKQIFHRRPELKTNTAFRDVVEHFKTIRIRYIDTDESPAEGGERSQAEFIKVVEGKQKAAENRADGLIKELEQEMTELHRRSTELKQHSHTEDHLLLLKTFPSLCNPKHTKDWSEVSVHSDTVGQKTVSELEQTLQEELEREVKRLCDVELKTIQQWSADVTLDPDTAHPFLFLSRDRKQVRYRGTWQTLPDNVKKFYNPDRFSNQLSVLGKECFSSGRFYYEVQVKGKDEWFLGVARESINRKDDINMSHIDGLWTVYMRGEDIYEAYTSPPIPLSLREKPQKVGVFVDYEGGRVSFYNVEARAHIYSFIGCTFTEKLYPYFNTCDNEFGPNSGPFVICPVNH